MTDRSAALKELREIRSSRFQDAEAHLALAEKLLNTEGEERTSAQAEFDRVTAHSHELDKRQRALEWELAETEEDKAALEVIEEIEAKIGGSFNTLKENMQGSSPEKIQRLWKEHQKRLAAWERQLSEAQSRLQIGFESGQDFFTVAYIEPNDP